VRPGDELRIECEVIEVRPSKSRPEQGLIKLRTTTLNQDGEAVLVHVLNLVVLRRKDIRQDYTTVGKLQARVEVIAVPNDTQCPGTT
jgi:hypothetical protein